MISEKDYMAALKICQQYEFEQSELIRELKEKMYDGLTKDNILIKQYKSRFDKKCFLIGLSRDGVKFINEDDGEYTIEESFYGSKPFYTITGGKTTYNSYDDAFKAIIKKLKTNKKIS